MALCSSIDKMSLGNNFTARKRGSDIIVRHIQRTSVSVLQYNVTGHACKTLDPDLVVSQLCHFILLFS